MAQIQGPAGPAGVQGPRGNVGPQGPIGPQGGKGDPGPSGANGARGTSGPQGSPGAPGRDGSPGAPGATGSKGDTGPAGADGAQADHSSTPQTLALIGSAGASSLSAPADHVHAHPAQFVSSIAALRALGKPSVSFAYVRVTGYYADGDGGGGKFTWFPSSSLSDDGGAVINPTGNSGNGRWLRNILVNNLNVKWWGAKGTYDYPSDTTDDHAAFAAVLAYVDRVLGINAFPLAYKVYVPTGNYRLSLGLSINRPIDFYGDGITSSNLLFITAAPSGDPLDGIILNRSSNIGGPSGYDSSGAIVRDMSLSSECGITGEVNPSLPLYAPSDPLTSTTTGHSYLPGNGVAILSHGCWVARCLIAGFRFDGVHVEAIAGSDNANDFRVVDCTINQNGRHGIFTAGDNGNAGFATGCDINNNAGWGIYDRSFLGNYYEAHQTAVNGSVAQASLAVMVDSTAPIISGQTTSPIWIGSRDGGAYRSTRDNQTWRAVNNGLQNPSDPTGDNGARMVGICAFAIADNDKIFAASGAVNAGILPGGVFWASSASKPDAWTQSNTGLTNLDVRALAWGNDVLLAGTVGDGIFVSSDEAATWTATGMTTGNVRALIYDPNNVGTFYAATDAGVFKSTDSGATWTAINTGISTLTTLSLAIAFDSSAIYVGASDGTLYQSTDGSTWSLVFTEGGAFPIQGIAVMLADTTKIFAATGGAGMYVSADTGSTWTQSNSGLTDFQYTAPLLDIRSVATDQLGVVYVAPIGNVHPTREYNNGGAYRSVDNGATWTYIATTLINGGSYTAVGGSTSPCVFNGCYSEGGQPVWIQSPSIIVGGVLGVEGLPADDDWPVSLITGGHGIDGIPLRGPFFPKIRRYSNVNDVDVQPTDCVVIVDTPSAHLTTISMPDPVIDGIVGQILTIIKGNASVYHILVTGHLDPGGPSNIEVLMQGASVTLLATTDGWKIVGSYDLNDWHVTEQALGVGPAVAWGHIPLYAGNYLVTVYYRVTGAPTDVSLTVTWTDVGGAQSQQIVNVSAQDIGSYGATLLINAIAGDPGEIEISATCSTGGNVLASMAAKFMQ